MYPFQALPPAPFYSSSPSSYIEVLRIGLFIRVFFCAQEEHMLTKMSQTFHITIVQTTYTNAHGRRSLVRGRVVDEKHLKKRDAKGVKSRSTRMQRLLGNMKATKRGTTCARSYKTEKIPIEQAANKPRGEDI